MISSEDAPFTYESRDHYKILPSIMNDPLFYYINKKNKVSQNFNYISNNNKNWISSIDLSNWLKKYPNYF
tara:strand:+ start:262 stop:471 length:210 start_codon:yes stop_codon:yes gene_type:complete